MGTGSCRSPVRHDRTGFCIPHDSRWAPDPGRRQAATARFEGSDRAGSLCGPPRRENCFPTCKEDLRLLTPGQQGVVGGSRAKGKEESVMAGNAYASSRTADKRCRYNRRYRFW